jgi:hypothetical protein
VPQINQLSAYDSPQSGDQLPVFSTGNGDARKMSLSVLTTWLSTAFSNLTASSYLKVTPVAVASLPSAVTSGAGARAFVTDATSHTFHAAPVGGGAQIVPVYSDGTIWRIG